MSRDRETTRYIEEVAGRVAQRHKGPEISYGIVDRIGNDGAAWVKRSASEQPSGGWRYTQPPQKGDLVRLWRKGQDRWLELLEAVTTAALVESRDSVAGSVTDGLRLRRLGDEHDRLVARINANDRAEIQFGRGPWAPQISIIGASSTGTADMDFQGAPGWDVSVAALTTDGSDVNLAAKALNYDGPFLNRVAQLDGDRPALEMTRGFGGTPVENYLEYTAKDLWTLSTKGFKWGGTSFPPSADVTDKALCWRTDLGRMYYWSAAAARWLSVQRSVDVFHAYQWAFTATLPAAMRCVATGVGRNDVLLHEWNSAIYVAGANSGANYWSIGLYMTSAAGRSFLWSFDSKAVGGSNVWLQAPTTPNMLMGAAAGPTLWEIDVTKVGAPGDLHIESQVLCREAYT